QGVKKKQSEINREITSQEAEILKGLHISYDQDDPYGKGEYLYHTITLTGDALGERQIYSTKDLEELISLSFHNEKMNGLNVFMDEEYQGIDLRRFLELNDISTKKDIYLDCFSFDGHTKSIELKSDSEDISHVMLAFSKNYIPLIEEEGGPVALVWTNQDGTQEVMGKLDNIMVSEEKEQKDPKFQFHSYSPYDQDKDLTFTIRVFLDDAIYLGPIQSRIFTMEELEAIATTHPEAVTGNYYGLIGNSESRESMGIGGWLDYFEGIDLKWLLEEEMEFTQFQGYAKLFGRDMEEYGEIDNLGYFDGVDDPDQYYVMTQEGDRIPSTIPMIAYSKNGYPLLADHDHDTKKGYVAYNQLNNKLESLGIETEIGVVKNHNGPFILGLGNRDGYYGGYQVETGGDCIQMDIYLQEK
ncbi:MAG TPA: molybdopterin-dependent oxidoreductase, partial [Candidatus Merdenecus merdavium]|nr:molybdopterin-dependent oxidoreductase [Candidatus Merdenecus merdavium]